MRVLTLSVLVVTFYLAATGFVAAHPSDGCTPGAKPSGYETPECQAIGDLRFDYEVTPWNDLTPAEQYIIAGGTSATGGHLKPWWLHICEAAIFFNETYGTIPEQYRPDMLANMAADPTTLTNDQLEWFCSPLTGQLPMLTAEEFTPGSIYLRELTDAEMAQAAQQDQVLSQALAGSHTDQETCETRGMELLTKVYYYRVYGLNSVLHAGLLYAWDYTD